MRSLWKKRYLISNGDSESLNEKSRSQAIRFKNKQQF